MRKGLLFILICWSAAILGANPLSVISGKATLLPNPIGIDYVFIFADINMAELSTDLTEPQWKNLSTNMTTTGVTTFSPETNTAYELQGREDTISFYIIDYKQHRPTLHSFKVDYSYENRCNETRLILEADIPNMFYQTSYGTTEDITRKCQINYSSLSWNDEAWVDSVCDTTVTLQKTILVPAPLQNTIFTLVDNQFNEELELVPDSIVSDEYITCAIDAHPVTITTTRGGEELSNESERPTEETMLSGSAPLDILFKSNGSPGVQYYQWQIFKGNDLLVQRTDAEHRYTFDDYGEYRALLWVSNDSCQTDSTEFNISVATSLLLVPNVFTPNGDDKNDEFRVAYRSITSFQCWVYNRWGKKVYEWTDPAKGWDGTINGRPAAESAYFYVIRATGADGTEYKLKGDINLIRGKK